MSKRPTNDEEPKRVGRTGLGGGQQSQRLHVPSDSARPASRGPATFERYARPQRVVVKVHIVRHHSPQKGRESIGRHVSYLTREAVTRDMGSGRFYDAKRDDLNAKEETQSWAKDRHHFRIILAPENARSLHDLKAYVREVMTRVEHDLGALEWLAVNHSNTSQFHAHLLFRGRAHDGTDLVISREYISNGIRRRAAEVATEWLGERTREEAQIALAKEVRAERWTSLDGALARLARPETEGLHIDFKNVKISRYALITRELLSERLKFLKEAGLAAQLPVEKRTFLGKQPVWRLAPDFQKKLNELGARNDVIMSLYAALGDGAASLAAQVQRMPEARSLSGASHGAVRGVVIAKGAINELSDERFVVLEDRAGKAHYARLWANEALDAVRVGGVMEVGRSASRRLRIAREITRVAEHAKDMLYSTGRHRKWLETQQPRPSTMQMEQRLRGFAMNVVNLAKRADSGVTRATENAYTIDRAKLEQFIAARNRWPDVRVLAAHALSEQVQAHAYTWLDRQMVRVRMAKELSASDFVRNVQIQSAIAKRSDWLVEHGYVKREGRDAAAPVSFLPGAVARLIANEHREFAQNCNHHHAKRVNYLREGQAVAGVYRGMLYQHRGSFALIETDGVIFAAPVSKAPWAEQGQKVTARGVAPKYTRIELDKTGGPSKKFGVER